MKRRDLLENLIKFGFTVDQARLYLAGLKLGPALMAPLAREAEIKRTTVYYLMEELRRRGFFSVKNIGKRIYYITASPQQLLEMARQRQILIKRLLPHLQREYIQIG